MQEMLDIYTEEYKHIGVAPRTEVHSKGYWHQTFHCWVFGMYDDEPHVILQRRSATKDTNPNKLDISCAGHLMAGETVSDGLRELQEELGISVDSSQLAALGLYNDVFETELIKDREFSHVFLYHCEQPFAHFRPQVDEISGLFHAPLASFIQFFRGNRTTVTLEGYFVNEAGTRQKTSFEASISDFVPRNKDYYITFLERAMDHLHTVG